MNDISRNSFPPRVTKYFPIFKILHHVLYDFGTQENIVLHVFVRSLFYARQLSAYNDEQQKKHNNIILKWLFHNPIYCLTIIVTIKNIWLSWKIKTGICKHVCTCSSLSFFSQDFFLLNLLNLLNLRYCKSITIMILIIGFRLLRP